MWSCHNYWLGLRPWNTSSTLKARWAFSCRPLRFFNGPLWGPCCDNLRRWGQQTFQRGWPHTWRSTASLPCQPRSSPWYWWPKQGSLNLWGMGWTGLWNHLKSQADGRWPMALSAVLPSDTPNRPPPAFPWETQMAMVKNMMAMGYCHPTIIGDALYTKSS